MKNVFISFLNNNNRFLVCFYFQITMEYFQIYWKIKNEEKINSEISVNIHQTDTSNLQMLKSNKEENKKTVTTHKQRKRS